MTSTPETNLELVRRTKKPLIDFVGAASPRQSTDINRAPPFAQDGRVRRRVGRQVRHDRRQVAHSDPHTPESRGRETQQPRAGAELKDVGPRLAEGLVEEAEEGGGGQNGQLEGEEVGRAPGLEAERVAGYGGLFYDKGERARTDIKGPRAGYLAHALRFSLFLAKTKGMCKRHTCPP